MGFSQDSTDVAPVTPLGHGKHPGKLQLLPDNPNISTDTHKTQQGHSLWSEIIHNVAQNRITILVVFFKCKESQ